MIVEQILKKITPQFETDATGHDIHHILRVLNVARKIQKIEGGDLETIELAALLHDISDHKFNGGKLNAGGEIAYNMLIDLNYDKEKALKIKYIVDNVSYKGSSTPAEMNSIEGMIVQDADRLDAIGAIGIARTFAYGGNKNQPIHDPELKAKDHKTFDEYVNSKSSTINHFYEKLLLLSERLNTETGKQIGKQRHQFMLNYLDQFFNEWNYNIEN
jgi:uncharacterized protein